MLNLNSSAGQEYDPKNAKCCSDSAGCVIGLILKYFKKKNVHLNVPKALCYFLFPTIFYS